MWILKISIEEKVYILAKEKKKTKNTKTSILKLLVVRKHEFDRFFTKWQHIYAKNARAFKKNQLQEKFII